MKHNLRLRPRSKSIAAPIASTYKSENESEDDSCASEPGNKKTPTNAQNWTPDEQLRLICKVMEFSPRLDNIPYDERLEKVNWKQIKIEKRTYKNCKSEFYRILETCRTFRLLKEIIEEKHAELIRELGIERPLPAFALFGLENKTKINKATEKNVKGSFLQASSILFNELSVKERNAYVEKSRKLKKEYDRKMALYELPKGIKKARTYKKSNDKPLQLYIQRRRLEDTDTNIVNLRKEYLALPRNDKIIWILRWLGLKQGEKANLEQYLKCKNTLGKHEMDALDSYEGRPRRMSAYNIFIRESVANKSGNHISHRENFKSCISEWNSMPENEKAYYKQLAKSMKNNFTAEFTRFVSSLPIDRHDYEISHLPVNGEFSKPIEKSVQLENASDKYSMGPDLSNSVEVTQNEDMDVYKEDNPNFSDDGNDSYEYRDSDQEEVVYNCVTGVTAKSTNDQSSEDEKIIKKESKPMSTLQSTPFAKERTDFEPSHQHRSTKRSKVENPMAMKMENAKQKHNSPLKTNSAKHRSEENILLSSSKVKREESMKVPSLPEGPMTQIVRQTPKKIKNEQFSDSMEELLGKKSKKRKTSHSDFQEEYNGPSVKKEKNTFKKFQADTTERSTINISSDQNSDAEEERQKRLFKKFSKIFAYKPPETIVEYYANQSFDGISKKAKKAMKRLSEDEKNQLDESYNHAKEKYRKKFLKFSQNLTIKELSLFSSQV